MTKDKNMKIFKRLILMTVMLTLTVNAEPLVRYVEVDVVANQADEFVRIVKEEMQQAISKEQGVLAMYAVVVKGAANKFRFFEIYADEAAYQAHLNTPHFKKYIEKTQTMIIRKDFIETGNVLLLNKANFMGADKTK